MPLCFCRHVFLHLKTLVAVTVVITIVVKTLVHKSNPGTIKGYIEFHEVTEAPVQGGNNFAGSGTCSAAPVITGDDTNGYEITLTFATRIEEPAIGTYGVAFYSQYDAFGMRADNSENMYFDDVSC